jgi:hypothetical protein
MALERRSIKKLGQLLLYAIPAILALVVLFSLIKLFTAPRSNEIVSTDSVDKVEVNRDFLFPLRDSTGAVTADNLKYSITSSERSRRIIYQGKQATAVKGRMFLILNIKIENPTTNSLSIKTRDFIRLTPEGTQDRLAPDIHNDPADVQAISTKLTRVGFAVDENVKNFKLYVGEINGEKQEIDLVF